MFLTVFLAQLTKECFNTRSQACLIQNKCAAELSRRCVVQYQKGTAITSRIQCDSASDRYGGLINFISIISDIQVNLRKLWTHLTEVSYPITLEECM